MTQVTRKNVAHVRSAPRVLIAALAGGLLLAHAGGAHAEVPKELEGTWYPCNSHFTTHPHDGMNEWIAQQLRFSVKDEFFGDKEYYFDIDGSLTNSMQDMTLHIVPGMEAIPQPQINPKTVCNDGKLPALTLPAGDFTYMVGIVELAGEDGLATPHFVFFIPMRIGSDLKDRHFAFGVVHLAALGASGVESESLSAAQVGLSEDALRALRTGDERALRPYVLGLLLYILNHNGIVHGPS